jgi:protein O-GlcNAc transferase
MMNRRQRRVHAKAGAQVRPAQVAIAPAPSNGQPLSALANRKFNQGNAAAVQGRFDVAVRCYEETLAILPDDFEGWSNLGCALWRMSKLDRAAACFKRALAIRPAYAEAHSNLGGVLEAQDRTEEAITHYRRAIQIRPDYALAHCNLAGALLRGGHLEGALGHYMRAVQLDPGQADAHSNLGALLQACGQTELAAAAIRRALALQPDHPKALSNLGDVLRIQGHVEEAIDAYQKSLRAEPGDWAQRVKIALTQPILIESGAGALRLRARLIASLEALLREGVVLDDPNRDVGMTNFYLAYHGLNDREIQSQIARFYRGACPRLEWTAPHCLAPLDRAPRRRLRIGIVSSCLRDHTVGKFYRGIVAQLSRERFEVVLFRPAHELDAVAEAIDRAADRFVEIRRDLYPAREQIAAERPDILFYPEIGMDPLPYFLAFARLAPIQCVSWGHPVTTGIPTIDYFLSARDLEPPEAQAHYSERLIRLERLPTYYRQPDCTMVPLARERFGLPDNATLYLCPQSLFKFHPDFDLALATLLRRDPNARIVLITGSHAYWDKLLAVRLTNGFPDIASRVVFIPRVQQTEFLGLLLMADVLLDPPYFGGGNTTYEALAIGVPIVTWPGPFMRGRVTQACYRQMGFTELIADSLDSYVDIAIRLAHDPAWRTSVGAEIGRRSRVLFEDAEAVAELERFFAAAWMAHGRGEQIGNGGGNEGLHSNRPHA